MTFFFEITGPFDLLPRTNHVGALKRWIWLYFSIGYIKGDINDMIEACRLAAEEEKNEK